MRSDDRFPILFPSKYDFLPKAIQKRINPPQGIGVVNYLIYKIYLFVFHVPSVPAAAQYLHICSGLKKVSFKA